MRFRYSTDEKGRLVKKALVYTLEEHKIDYGDVDPQAVSIIEKLSASGFETYIVGGAVRDLILGKKPKDFDIVTSANPSKIKKIFYNARIIGNRFRLVHVQLGKKIFEVSTFRSNVNGSIGNVFGAVEDDVLRRDFTINALYYDPIKQIVVDFVNGMKDIKAGKLRPIIPLQNIFSEDPVRMIRAVKYGTITGFSMPLFLRVKIRQQSSLLAAVSPSRLTEEIFKIIQSACAAEIIGDLDSIGLYKYLQPNAASLFRTKPGFRELYVNSFSGLNSGDVKNLPGQALAAMIGDYLESITDWNTIGQELTLQECYKAVFIAARKFVLPMNPPRVELDMAVRLIFAKHGFNVRRSRFSSRGREKSVPEKGAPEKSGQQKANNTAPGGIPGRTGYHPRKKNPPSAEPKKTAEPAPRTAAEPRNRNPRHSTIKPKSET